MSDVAALRYEWSLLYRERLLAERQVARWEDRQRALRHGIKERDHEQQVTETDEALALARSHLVATRAREDEAMTELSNARRAARAKQEEMHL